VLDTGKTMTTDKVAFLLQALLEVADANKVEGGWTSLGQYTLTLHAASNGAQLSFAKIDAIKIAGSLVQAKSARGETHIIRLEDIFAGTVEASRETGRKAGFV
jgi:hypothetical protein